MPKTETPDYIRAELESDHNGFHAKQSAQGTWHIYPNHSDASVAYRRSDASALDMIRRYREGFRIGREVTQREADRTLQEVLHA
jgi:hypothetical protein